MTFPPYTYLRPTPLPRADADTMPEAAAPSLIARASGRRRFFNVVGYLGLATYGLGLPVILAEYLPR